MLQREQLAALAGAGTAPVVSIYLPTHEKGREVRQDPIRMRNALATVTQRLVEAGHRRPDVDAWLAPAHALEGDQIFWRHQAKGIAVFVGPNGLFQVHKLPAEVQEQQVIGRNAYVKPLLPLLADDGHYYVLTAQADDTRLYVGTRHSLAEMHVDMERSVESVTAETDYENTRHAAPPARPRSAGPVGMPGTHNFGEDPEEQRHAQLIEHLRRVMNALEREFSGNKAPLIVVAQPNVQGHLRALAKNVELYPEGIQADPDSLSEAELHERTYELVRPVFAKAREEALDKFRMLAGQGDQRAAVDLGQIVPAAVNGRVESLVVAEGAAARGRYDRERNEARFEPAETPENEDLVDLAVVQTLANGGSAWVLPQGEMPRDVPACAILRF
jgi:Bacterial archaeo-eukaryotic release factor family 3